MATAAAATLLFDQLADLGDPLPASVPGDEASFCALVQGAGAAAVVGKEGPLATLARELVRRARVAEAGMEEEEDEVGGYVCGVRRWLAWAVG